jgi:hypothetical protein
MSWKIGKSKSKQSPGNSSLTIQDMDTSRSTTPTPRNPDGSRPHLRSGILAIHVNRAEGLELPPGVQIPPAVRNALASSQAQAALSISPSSVAKQRLAKKRGHKDSVQRIGCWWLPYLVMEFEVNQIVLTPLGGDIGNPIYMYQATLYVLLPPSSTNAILTRVSSIPAMSLETRKYLCNVTFALKNRNAVVTVSQTIWGMISTWVESDLRPILMIWVHRKNNGMICLAGVGKGRL